METYRKVLNFMSHIVLIIGMVMVVLAGVIYGASFFFDIELHSKSIFNAGCDVMITGMVLVMWIERCSEESV